MKMIKLLYLLVLALPFASCSKNNDIIDVACFVDTTGQHDCSDKIQELINNNPHRTLYFRDGTYLLNHQILTPGDPSKSVDLQLSNYAILRASDSYQVKRGGVLEEWQDQYLYMVALGGLDRENNVTVAGSVFSLTGGIIDGGNVHAAGVEIAGGRETRVQNVSMKNVKVGLRIAKGVNSGSSDADIQDMSIICDDSEDSYGLKLEGSDNSATNIRIGHVAHGVVTTGGTNILRNVHPLHNADCLAAHYDKSIGFEINNFTVLNNCYSDNFRIAYQVNESSAFLTDCIAWWFNPGGSNREEYAFNKAANEFNCSVNNFVMGVREKRDGEKDVNAKIMIGNETLEGDGYLHNIHARNREFIQDALTIDAGKTYKPKADSLLAQYLSDSENINSYH